MNLENEVTALETKWEQFDVSCRAHVADEIVRNRVESAKQDPAALLAKYPRMTFDQAVQACEYAERLEYDAKNGVDGLVAETDTHILEEAIGAQITAAEELPGERHAYGPGQDKTLMGAMLEELQLQRLTRDLSAMTTQDALRAYAGWRDDEAEYRTSIRLIESLAAGTPLARFALKPDPDHDATAIPALRKAVATRRQTRVPSALRALHARVQGTRTLVRRQFLQMRREGRGIANRPGLRVA